ncbi:MAG: Rid family hydrolase [Flavobacterium sp.]|nr:Rid family hydrolase [Flavobacterium sp.]
MAITASTLFIHAGLGYSNALLVLSSGVKTIYIAGLTGNGSNLEVQTKATFANIKAVFEAASASLKDIVKMNTYIVNYQPENIEVFRKVGKKILDETNMQQALL